MVGTSKLFIYGSRNKCVRLEIHFVGEIIMGGVAEWTERRRRSAKIRVRFPVQAGRFWLQNLFIIFVYYYFL